MSHLVRAISSNPSVQWSIVWRGSDLTDAQIDRLQPASLINACIEVIELARCVHSDERLVEIIIEEVSVVAPELGGIVR
jgi:hypothetical protein